MNPRDGLRRSTLHHHDVDDGARPSPGLAASARFLPRHRAPVVAQRLIRDLRSCSGSWPRTRAHPTAPSSFSTTTGRPSAGVLAITPSPAPSESAVPAAVGSWLRPATSTSQPPRLERASGRACGPPRGGHATAADHNPVLALLARKRAALGPWASPTPRIGHLPLFHTFPRGSRAPPHDPDPSRRQDVDRRLDRHHRVVPTRSTRALLPPSPSIAAAALQARGRLHLDLGARHGAELLPARRGATSITFSSAASRAGSASRCRAPPAGLAASLSRGRRSTTDGAERSRQKSVHLERIGRSSPRPRYPLRSRFTVAVDPSPRSPRPILLPPPTAPPCPPSPTSRPLAGERLRPARLSPASSAPHLRPVARPPTYAEHPAWGRGDHGTRPLSRYCSGDSFARPVLAWS